MLPFRYNHVCIESYAFIQPPHEVSSLEIEDKLAALYKRLKIPFGTLEKLSGIKFRRFFDRDQTPSSVATLAGQRALDQIGFDRDQIQSVFNCSVTRDYFEPATASLVHKNLGFNEDSMSMDITNACLGFSNGMVTLANMIELGAVKAGLIVSGENLSRITDATMRKLIEDDDITRDELLKLMPTFTLGSGAVAMVLCHDSIATQKHRILGSVSRAASEYNDLCIGNGDFCFLQEEGLNPIMETQSHKLMAAAAKLGARSWKDLSEVVGWTRETIDRIFCHQVGKQVNSAFYRTMGLPMEKEYTVYERFGNLVSAAMPSALISAAEENVLKAGDKIVLTAFGSGLNSVFTGVVW